MARYEGRHSSAPARAPKHTPKPQPKPRPEPKPKPAPRPRPEKARAEVPVATRTEAAKKKKRRKKLWRAALALYALALLIGSGYGIYRFWHYVDEQQTETDRTEAASNARAAHEKALFQAPQLAFEDWQNALTADYWTDLWYEQSPNDLDRRDAVREYMSQRFAPEEIGAYKAPEFTRETPVYVLQNGGGETLARITLAGEELDWTVADVELLFAGEHSAAVTVPDGCEVLCNGQSLGGEYRREADSLMGYHELDEVLENPVAWVRYEVDGLLLEPELTAKAPEGFDLVQTGEDGYLLLDKSDTAAYAERAVEFVKKDVFYFMSGGTGTGGNMGGALAFLRRGTQAYADIQNTYESIRWTTHHFDIDLSKTYAGDVLRWADNCFSIDVSYDADCTLRGQAQDYADATMRLYFLREGDGYYLSNFQNL